MMENQIEIYHELGIGTRIRRLYETLSMDTDRLYMEAGLNFKVSYFYVIYALSKQNGLTISEISERAGFTHSAVSQTVKKLSALGYVNLESGEDGRQKLVMLTEQGRSLLISLRPLWAGFETVMKQVVAETSHDFMMALTGMETTLSRHSFYDRVKKHLHNQKGFSEFSNMEVISYEHRFQTAFYDLNRAWLEQYFVVEPIDERVLSDPEAHILGKGGEVFFAVEEDRVLGVVAMKASGNGVFELTKLAVDPDVRKGGVGRALCEKVIERFQARGGTLLYLETNTLLENAIRLYKKLGFKELPNPIDSPYERSNFYMEWRG